MREIGIVKWFGGYNSKTGRNNDYGFVTREGKPEIYVHRTQINCPETALREGTPVIFEVNVNAQNGQEQAIRLCLLAEETDREVLNCCVRSKDRRVWEPILKNYILTLSDDQANFLILEKINHLYRIEKDYFIHYLPQEIWHKFLASDIQKEIPPEDYISLCINLSSNPNSNLDGALREAIISNLKKIKNYLFVKAISDFLLNNFLTLEEIIQLLTERIESLSSFKRQLFVTCIPQDVLLSIDARSLRNFLPVENQIKLCIKIFEQANDEMVKNRNILPKLKEELIYIFCNKLKNDLDDKSIPWSSIPDAIILDERIWSLVPRLRRFDILVKKLDRGSSSDQENTVIQIAKILYELPHEKRALLIPKLQKLSNWNLVKKNEAIFPFLKSKDKIHILASRLSESKEIDSFPIILQIAQIIEESSPEKHPSLIAQLPDLVKQEPTIFQLLALDEQIELAYCHLENSVSLFWQQLSPKAKILCVYRITKKSINLANILSTLQRLQREKPENDLRVRCVLNLIRAKVHPLKRDEVFENADRLLIQYVVEQAQNSAESLTLEPLLPHCRPQKVKYCEGRPWLTEEDKQSEASKASRAFCPRTKCSCSLFNPNESENFGSNLEGARLYPECSQHWKDWSLLELLEAVGIMGILPESHNHNDYVQKLSGWVNRINEIRERLKCSVCRQMMPHNIEYAKFLAKFRVTVFSCPQGEGHDQNIYLNECWACGEIIDSRESKYFAKEDGYHICIHCGSGTKGSNIYTQGDSCPNCDMRAMAVSQYRRRQCCSCKHSIRLPDERKITGPKCPKCQTRGMMLILSRENEQIRICRSQSCGYSIKLSAQEHLSPPQQWEDEMSF
jgi:Zn ribbon nucleic-acid-binding protein